MLMYKNTMQNSGISDYRPIIYSHLSEHYKNNSNAYDKKLIKTALRYHGKQKGLKGAGLFSWLKNGYNAIQRFMSGSRLNFTPSMREFLSKHGDKQILELQITRQPIFSVIEKVASFLSGGIYDRNKQRLAYDKMFHLYAGIRLENSSFKIEKNHIIEIKPLKLDHIDAEMIKVDVSAGLTLNKLLENAQKIVTPKEFFEYESFSTNCQHFIKTLLKGSNLLTVELETFIMQDAKAVLENLSYLQKISNTVTGAASRLEHAYNGAGVEDKPKQKPKQKAKRKVKPLKRIV